MGCQILFFFTLEKNIVKYRKNRQKQMGINVKSAEVNDNDHLRIDSK